METCNVVLAFESVDKIPKGVTIHMKFNATHWQYVCIKPFVFSIFSKMKFRNFLQFLYLALLGVI